VALWVLFAHAHEAFDVSPILAITSPTKRCGKSLLEQIVGALLPRALTTSNISPAALFRAIEAYRPSLLIDEGDAFLNFSEELRGILNSGHTRRGAVVIRCDGDPIVARLFSTWTPKVVALIGALPGTVADRSVEIRMQRKGKGEVAERFRSSFLAEIDPLCRQAARWAADNLAHLKTIDPAVPDSLNDRAADNWRSLLAIADLAGGEWLKRARQAALALSGESDAEGEGHGVTLIGDIVTIFAERDADRLSSIELIEELVKLELRPWNAWTRGKPITPRGLARLLKPFDIKPKVERLEGKETLRGYMVEDFFSVSSRYYGNLSVTSVTSEQNQGVIPDFYVLQNPSCYGYENDVTIEKQRDVTHVTDRIPESGGKRETSAQRELFEEDDPGLLAARLTDAEEMRTPAWEEVEI
jgi:putative DNA primase/helicase